MSVSWPPFDVVHTEADLVQSIMWEVRGLNRYSRRHTRTEGQTKKILADMSQCWFRGQRCNKYAYIRLYPDRRNQTNKRIDKAKDTEADSLAEDRYWRNENVSDTTRWRWTERPRKQLVSCWSVARSSTDQLATTTARKDRTRQRLAENTRQG